MNQLRCIDYFRQRPKLDAALEVTPSEVYIDADANQGWESAQWTVSTLRAYAGYNNLSIEQPLHYADLSGAAHVRAQCSVPVILDESVWSARAMLQLARLNACDRIVLKLNRVGGFFEALKIVSICESAGIGVSVDTNPYTLIGDTAVYASQTVGAIFPISRVSGSKWIGRRCRAISNSATSVSPKRGQTDLFLTSWRSMGLFGPGLNPLDDVLDFAG